MSGRLQTRVAVITGASAGIGQACAPSLMREGASLVLTRGAGIDWKSLRTRLNNSG